MKLKSLLSKSIKGTLVAIFTIGLSANVMAEAGKGDKDGCTGGDCKPKCNIFCKIDEIIRQ